MDKKIAEKYYFNDEDENYYTLYYIDDERFTIDKNDEKEITLSEMFKAKNLLAYDYEEEDIMDADPYEADESWTPVFNSKGEHISDLCSPIFISRITKNIYWSVSDFENSNDMDCEIDDNWDKNILNYFKELNNRRTEDKTITENLKKYKNLLTFS